MTQLLDSLNDQISKRIAELQPLVDEYNQLQQASRSLSSPGTPVKAASAPRAGRPRKGEPSRADQFLVLVKQTPGITVSEAAKALGMAKPAALYQVAKKLEESGVVTKSGSGYSPA